ncbi:MAG TPA: hypothetical protein VJV74_12630, partial [Terriglobia bacterium]|nr:hypothetical protein [Terriglobia bacterium]
EGHLHQTAVVTRQTDAAVVVRYAGHGQRRRNRAAVRSGGIGSPELPMSGHLVTHITVTSPKKFHSAFAEDSWTHLGNSNKA